MIYLTAHWMLWILRLFHVVENIINWKGFIQNYKEFGKMYC